MRGLRQQGWRGRVRRIAAPLVFVGLLGGCESLLVQEAPSSIRAEDLDTPAAAPLLLTSVIAAFECALTQVNVYTGQISDELNDGLFLITGWDLDRRTLLPTSATHALPCGSQQVPGFYTPVSQARFLADDVVRRFENFTDAEVPNRVRMIGQSAAYAGFGLAILGENMCSAAIDLGPEMTPAQLFAAAESRFDKAIASATTANDQQTLNMARVGRARVRLNLNKKAEARADAALVPAGFIAVATHATTPIRRENLVWDTFFQGFWATVDPSFRGLTFAGVPDTSVLRVGTVTDAGRLGFDNQTRIWRTNKYPAQTSPSPIAKYVEAQLIIAEIDGGQAAVNIINALHSRPGVGLPAFASTDPAAIAAQVIQERSRELYLEGRRLWDMIRFALPLVPAAGASYLKGGSYGTQLCIPFPLIEKQNNPNTR
jgi:hypothetical protein